MTSNDVLHPAEERLLDAGLAQVCAGQRHVAASRRDGRAWLVAALLLLGIGVVTASAWLVRSTPYHEAQEPERPAMPAEVRGEGRSGLEALPATTANVLARFVDPRELPVVERFEGLRALRLWPQQTTIFGISTGSYHGAWSKPPADLLEPLARLPHLEVLGLPHELTVSPELLAPLAGHPSLREIHLVRDGFRIDERFVAALAQIPHLGALHLSFVPVGGDALRHLCALPLTSLELEWCHDLDATGWRAITSMRTLRRLSFRGAPWNTKSGQAAAPVWRPAPEDLRRLVELPRLRHLDLLQCGIDDEQLAVLPDTLTTLRLFGTKLTPEGIGGLRRLVALRELGFDASTGGISALVQPDSEVAADAFAAALPTLRLRRLHYGGALTPAVVEAIGAQSGLGDLSVTSKQPGGASCVAVLPLQRVVWRAPVTTELLEALASRPDLRELELCAPTITDVAPLAKAPRLERLRLAEDSIGDGIAASVLAPLAASPSLRELAINVSVARGEARASKADLQQALGDRIRLDLHENEFTVKK